VTLDFSRPGKPIENAYIASFNDSFRDECLNINWFLSLEDAREKIEEWRRDYNEWRRDYNEWRRDYNEWRPHSSLDNLTPSQYLERQETTSTRELFPIMAGTVLG